MTARKKPEPGTFLEACQQVVESEPHDEENQLIKDLRQVRKDNLLQFLAQMNTAEREFQKRLAAWEKAQPRRKKPRKARTDKSTEKLLRMCDDMLARMSEAI